MKKIVENTKNVEKYVKNQLKRVKNLETWSKLTKKCWKIAENWVEDGHKYKH